MDLLKRAVHISLHTFLLLLRLIKVVAMKEINQFRVNYRFVQALSSQSESQASIFNPLIAKRKRRKEEMSLKYSKRLLKTSIPEEDHLTAIGIKIKVRNFLW